MGLPERPAAVLRVRTQELPPFPPPPLVLKEEVGRQGPNSVEEMSRDERDQRTIKRS